MMYHIFLYIFCLLFLNLEKIEHISIYFLSPISKFRENRTYLYIFSLRPPRAARPPTSRCQARSTLHALISPLISLLNPSSSRPAINGVKAITADRFPLPRPGVPLPGHYKRTRSTPPGHHHTHLALNRLLPSPQRPLHRVPPPPIVPHRRSVMSDPPPPPLAAGEAHLRPLSIFPQPQ
jgi:hypothetical protein